MRFPKLRPTIKFQLIMTEFSRYNVLKEAVWAELTQESSRPDIEKIKKDVCSEMEVDFRKKELLLAPVRINISKLQFRLSFWRDKKACVTLHVTKSDKTLVRGAWWLFRCLARARTFPAADKAAVVPI